MRFIRGLHNLPADGASCVATIGNFDGVHLGHQAVIGQLAETAADMGLPTTLITFEPQPLEYFRPQQTPARLTRLREKLQALRRFSVDRVLCLPFNRKLAQMPAEDFIQAVLVDGLHVKYLVVDLARIVVVISACCNRRARNLVFRSSICTPLRSMSSGSAVLGSVMP